MLLISLTLLLYILAMELSLHAHPGALITNPSNLYQSIVSSIHPCSAYWFGPLSPVYSISEILGRSMTATFQLTTWILPRPLCPITDNTVSFGILSSDWILLIWTLSQVSDSSDRTTYICLPIPLTNLTLFTDRDYCSSRLLRPY